jgi:chromosome segregation protein
MLLKKIHLSGFKSFADRLTINFDSGITGIVGPNGSGKSNVIDAVRWVMGEQNAKNLRGQTATDIIFAGSAKRKSLSVAEVTLVFDNSKVSSFCPPEYRHETEVSLTRRLYRDGTRECLINKKSCRLKDLVSFFATTGLSGRSYSMIQQGQVERILNAKPEQIREILEEAAGTLVFKQRRGEAQKKLSTTEENLSRLDDIIAEIARQQNALEGQVEKAQKYRQLSDDLRNQEMNLLAHNYRFFREQSDRLELEDQQATQLVGALQEQLNEFDDSQKSLQSQLDDADPDIQGLQEKVSMAREDIARSEGTIMNADSLLESSDADMETLKLDLDQDRENLETIEAQFQKTNEELETARTHALELVEQIDNFQAEVDDVDECARVFENRIEDCEDQLKNIVRLMDSNTIRCESLNREQDKLREQRQQEVCRQDILKQELAGFNKELQEARETAASSDSGVAEQVARKTALDELTEERNQDMARLQTQKDELKEKYIANKARRASLEEFLESASDVVSTINSINDFSYEGKDLHHGLLTQHLSFREDIDALPPKTVAAIERWSERIVIKDFDSFNRLSRLAQQANAAIAPVSIADPANNEIDETALAAWVEKVDGESIQNYLNISEEIPELRRLMGRLVYLPCLELNSVDLKAMPRGTIVFTAQGLITTSQIDLEIGSQKGAGILSRKAELEVLAGITDQLEADLGQVQSKLDQCQFDQNNQLQELEEIDGLLNTRNKETMALMAALQSIEHQHKHKQELLDACEVQLQKFADDSQSAIHELSELGANRINLGEEQESVKAELESIKLESSSVEDQRDEVLRMHQARKVDLAKSETKAQTLAGTHSQSKEQLERLQSALSRRYDEQARFEDEIQEARTNREKALAEIGELITAREGLEQELLSKREENAGVVEQLRRLDRDLKELREKLHAADKNSSKINLDAERARLAVSSAVQQAAEKYHEDISAYKEEIPEDFTADKVSRLVSKIRGQIDNLGAINMMAIEEYDILKERSEFILAQRDEVLSSIDLLQEAISEMDESSKSRFIDSFTAINREFGQLFPILFPGGDAKLEMNNPDDPLNTGVDIMVHLPGKKQQHLSLFSGGEKALTAISLIFALLKSKPTPFCFLDEVDAPLDEANVGRYNRVLEALSDRFQFVVITHNRRTMEVLDTLYGVTMQEPGVSKVVGVDLNKDLPAHLRKAFKDNKRKGASANPTSNDDAPNQTVTTPAIGAPVPEVSLN